jgi:NADH:ubiquinone oxidoreductase subunit 2 (subunit N)
MLVPHISQAQVYGLVGLGAIYWGAAALAIRYAGHIMYANNVRRICAYSAIIPVGYLTIVFSEGLLGISSKHRLAATTIMCAAALLLDGVAFMWFPALYENPEVKTKNSHMATLFSRMGAAHILWGVGTILGVALFTQ